MVNNLHRFNNFNLTHIFTRKYIFTAFNWKCKVYLKPWICKVGRLVCGTPAKWAFMQKLWKWLRLVNISVKKEGMRRFQCSKKCKRAKTFVLKLIYFVGSSRGFCVPAVPVQNTWPTAVATTSTTTFATAATRDRDNHTERENV